MKILIKLSRLLTLFLPVLALGGLLLTVAGSQVRADDSTVTPTTTAITPSVSASPTVTASVTPTATTAVPTTPAPTTPPKTSPSPSATTATVPSCQTFPQTSFTVCGLFLQYWKANGGLTQQGYPISGVFYERNSPPPAGDGQLHLVQYFQRARFEYHPENQAPYQVLLGLLGAEQYTTRYKIAPEPDPAYYADRTDCLTFPETGFNVCGRFLEYWKANGGLLQQGYPISQVFIEQNAAPPAGDGKVHLVQYFQRARFEQHNENKRPYDVLLGLLGAEQYVSKYSVTPPEFLDNNIPPPTPAPGQDVIPANGCLSARPSGGPNGPTLVQACLQDGNPPQNATLTVYGRLIGNGQALVGTRFDATWTFPSNVTATCGGYSDLNGVASCSINLDGKAVAGTPVKIDIVMSYKGNQPNKVSISFTPR